MFCFFAIKQKPTPQLKVFNISLSEILLDFIHLKILFVLILARSKFKHKFLGIDLLILSIKPPPVICAALLIKFFFVKDKTTNNQRLLVELTLMRISSIGFDGDQKKNSKSFVVSINDAKREVSVERIAENNKKEEIPVFQDVKMGTGIKLNLGTKKKSSLISINSSFKEDKEIVEEDKSSLSFRDADFSETKLLEQWKTLIIFVKEKGKSNLGITLGVHNPKLLEGYLIELPLSNAAQAEMILEEKYIILEYLRNKLENDRIEITTRIVAVEKTNIPYTNKDKFKKMLDENPQLEILRIKLGLDPDY